MGIRILKCGAGIGLCGNGAIRLCPAGGTPADDPCDTCENYDVTLCQLGPGFSIDEDGIASFEESYSLGLNTNGFCPLDPDSGIYFEESGDHWLMTINSGGTTWYFESTTSNSAPPPMNPLSWVFISCSDGLNYILQNIGCCDEDFSDDIPPDVISFGGLIGKMNSSDAYPGPPNYPVWGGSLIKNIFSIWTPSGADPTAIDYDPDVDKVSVANYTTIDGDTYYVDASPRYQGALGTWIMQITHLPSGSSSPEWASHCRRWNEPMLLAYNLSSELDTLNPNLPEVINPE